MALLWPVSAPAGMQGPGLLSLQVAGRDRHVLCNPVPRLARVTFALWKEDGRGEEEEWSLL